MVVFFEEMEPWMVITYQSLFVDICKDTDGITKFTHSNPISHTLPQLSTLGIAFHAPSSSFLSFFFVIGIG